MDNQKFKEYRQATATGRNFLTRENILIAALALAAVFVWRHFFVHYVAAAVDENIFSSAAPLKVVFFDVGQGDSALVTTPGGKNILIDAGSLKGATVEESEDGSLITEIDVAGKVILPYFRKNGIAKLDALVITHPHIDHFGGALVILDEIPVELFVDNGLAVPNPYYADLLKKVRAKKIKYFQPTAGSLLPLAEDNFEIKFLLPRSMYDARDNSSINNSSLVARLKYKNFTALFTGDIETAAELELLNWKDDLRASVLKIAHHGSQTSATLPFLETVAPTVAVISCGRGNPYGHPHIGPLERLARQNIKTLRTDESGSVVIITDGLKFVHDTVKK